MTATMFASKFDILVAVSRHVRLTTRCTSMVGDGGQPHEIFRLLQPISRDFQHATKRILCASIMREVFFCQRLLYIHTPYTDKTTSYKNNSIKRSINLTKKYL